MTDPIVRLDLFTNPDFDRGAPRWKELLWLASQGLLFSSWLPGSGWRRHLLRIFGARVGKGVVIKPRVRVKFPWRLKIGDYSWIGEAVWIDNLAEVTIGSHSCLSQGAYLCTGSHDWNDPQFALIVRPITIGYGCWVGARVTLAPGAVMENGAVLGMGTVGIGRLAGAVIHRADGTTRLRWKNGPHL